MSRKSSRATAPLARICFWLSFFPVLVGAITIPLAPMSIRYYRDGLAAAGTESYHRDMRRGLVSSIGNLVVRSAGILLLGGFVAVAIRSIRRLQLVVFGGAIVVTAAHFMLPLIRGGLMLALASWVHPLFLLPLATAVLSGIALWRTTGPADFPAQIPPRLHRSE